MSDEAIFKTEDGNFVRFEWGTAQNAASSRTEGRPIFDKLLLATVTSPGMSKSEMVHEVERHYHDGRVKRREDLRQRFGRALDAWERSENSPETSGTPLSAWPALDVRRIAEMRLLNIHTVESLAEISDAGLQALGMGGRELKAQAAAFLEAAKGSAPAQKLAAENEELRAEVKRLGEQMKTLSDALEAAGARDGRTRAAKLLKEAAA